MGKVFEDVERLKSKYIKLWWEMDSCISSLKSYTNEERQAKQKQLDICIDNLFSQIKYMPVEEEKRAAWTSTLKETLKREAKQNLDIKNKELESIIIDGFMDVAEEFISSVRKFDNSIKMMDIMQAMRNVWIMNLIQVIANKKVEHTSSIFAYSMLYPYTDNYLDDISITNSEKQQFNARLKRRIEGEDIRPKNTHEEKIYKLLKMIETQYSRDVYPGVFESILSIHVGQCKSLAQQCSLTSPYENDVLSISAEKGGASVLADAYLVCGQLDEKLADLMFGFGFVLQLIDDLQDAKEDLANKSMTVFSQTLKGFELDAVTNKLISFTIKAMNFERYSESVYVVDIKELILSNTLIMIFEAIWRNKEFYSKRYIKDIQKYSPISFKYLKKTNKKVKKEMKKIKDLI